VTTTILTGDCRDILPTLPDQSVQMCVTSPPYLGLRDYGTADWDGGDPDCDHLMPPGGGTGASTLGPNRDGLGQAGVEQVTVQRRQQYRDTCGKCGAVRIDRQIGLEPTVDAYVAELVAVFREVRRVLRDDGALWLNLGDSYAGGGGYYPDAPSNQPDAAKARSAPGAQINGSRIKQQRSMPDGLKHKDLIGVPWRVAFALQADGWWLRQDIIWSKPNPMPESVTDRCTKSHEYLFLFSKQARYYFDAAAIAEPGSENSHGGTPNGGGPKQEAIGRQVGQRLGIPAGVTGTRNRRSVWTVATQPYADAHFATFPPKLIEPCILAGTSEAGQCPACGSPWVRVVERSGYNSAGRADETVYTGSAYQHPQSAPRGPKRNFGEPSTRTTGWQPSCTCNAGKPVPQTVLDPFGGSGTTGQVAEKFGRNSILIELNPEYRKMIEKRTAQRGLALGVA
jgi:DNA modification methylase